MHAISSGSTQGYMLATGETDKKRLDIQSTLAETPLKEAIFDWQSKSLLKNDFSGKILLDFGCGTGSACSILKSLFPNIIYQGLDKAGDSIESAQRSHPDEFFFVGNEESDTGRSMIQQADIVFVRFVVQHQQDPVLFIKNLTSVMKKGAKIIIFEPYSDTDLIDKNYPQPLYEALKSRLDYKFALGKIAGNQQNYAPQIKDQLEQFKLRKVQVAPIKIAQFPLDLLRELFTGSFNSMSQQLIAHNIATESEITRHVTTVSTHDNIDDVYLGSTYIILGKK